MEIKDITTQELAKLVREVLKGEWKLDVLTSYSFILYQDLLDDDYIYVNVFKIPDKNELDVSIVFDYSDMYHREERTFGNIDKLLSHVKKVNSLSLEVVKLELDTAFSNYVHKVLK